ncbi:MAG: GNAT family N-acetyltransferase [Myxococcales bacterium]|nr:GNAT family N-acetyltransferase [Myxococcales bacterium]
MDRVKPREDTDALRPRAPSDDERRALEDWLDDGLRRGERGRLRAEYPISMGAGPEAHRAVFAGGEPVAHAMWHATEVVGRGRLPVALVGNVYTAPSQRGRGLASACVEACVGAARDRGLPLALLWSDAPDWYARLGFHPVGRERFVSLDAGSLARARCSDRPLEVGEPRDGDWPELERLYAAKPQHVARGPGDLARLAAAPDCDLCVAREGGRALAYAAAGRGDDMQGVVHEWAGVADGVLACVAWLEERAGAHTLLSGPTPEPPVPRLRASGATSREGPFALARILDPEALWRCLAPDERGLAFERGDRGLRLRSGAEACELEAAAALELLFGSGARGTLAASLPDSVAARIADRLPWPLYLWGFDSI